MSLSHQQSERLYSVNRYIFRILYCKMGKLYYFVVPKWYLRSYIYFRRDLLLLFKGSTILATPLNTLTTSLQCSGNQQEVMWCQVLHRQEPLIFSSNNAISFFYYDAILSVRVSLSHFAPDGLISEDLINWSKFSLLYVVFYTSTTQLFDFEKCTIIYIRHV